MRFSEHLKKASLVGAFFVSVLVSFPAQALCPASGALTPAKVAKVIDGDTLRLADGRSVRLIGLNAPEMGRKGRRAEPFADAARLKLQAFVSASDWQVGLRSGPQAKDRYGRTLAHVYDNNDDNLEALLLAEGLGFFVAIAPNTQLVNCHRSVEEEARAAGRGLWRQSPVIPAKKLGSGGFAVITGKVRRVDSNRGGIWLELDGSAVLQIAHDVAPGFSSLNELVGREVEARGWVVDRKGRTDLSRHARWLLKISHPSMLVLPR